MSLHDRIKEARKQKGITQTELGSLIGVAKTTVAGYEKSHEPTAAQLGAIADALDVDVTFLLQDEIKTRREYTASPSEMEMVKKYRNLDGHGKKAIDYLLDHETQRVKQIESARAAMLQEEDNIVYLYKTSNKASAGLGFDLDYESMERWGVRDNELTSKADFIVEVDGKSMEPMFYDGDNLLIRRMRRVETGEIGLFVIPNEFGEYRGYVKKLGTSMDGHPLLISANEAYPDIFLVEGTECIGKVLGVLEPEWIVKT